MSPPNGAEMQGQGHCNSDLHPARSFSGPFPPLRCLFSARPVEKCFEKNETGQLNSIAMHDDSIVSPISFTRFFFFFFGGSVYSNIESINAIKFNEIFIM